MLFMIVITKSSDSALLLVGMYLIRAAFQVMNDAAAVHQAISLLIQTSCPLQNASYPLSESILMDYVPKKYRARWKSLESVVQFGWCGSAVVGGWIGDRYTVWLPSS